jgi:hypothetical protein
MIGRRFVAADLRSAALYLIALMVLVGGLLTGVGFLAQHVTASTAWQSWIAQLDSEEDGMLTHLHLAAENAREIRAALAKPMPSQQPLPPVTAKLAYGHLKGGRPKTGKKPAAASRTIPKLPKAALEAMASAKSERFPPPPRIELHSVY